MRQSGAALLTISVTLLFCMTLLALFLARANIINYKVFSNQYRSEKAFEAAEAGLEFGLTYLDANRPSIVVDSDNDGYIDAYNNAAINNVVLPDGSSYTITYTNPIMSNFDLINVSVTGVSDDGTATRTIQQNASLRSILVNFPPTPAITKGALDITGSSFINNTEGANTIWSGLGVTFDGNAAKTATATDDPASSNAVGTNGDVTENDSTLQTMTDDDFFQGFFGASADDVATQADYTFTDLGNYSNSVNGLTNSMIWINQTTDSAQINSNAVVGSPTEPVILIVNGNLWINGTLTIYGIVYATQDITAGTGNMTIYGSMIAAGDMYINGNFDLIYDETIFDRAQNTIGNHIKVAGSWKDY